VYECKVLGVVKADTFVVYAVTDSVGMDCEVSSLSISAVLPVSK